MNNLVTILTMLHILEDSKILNLHKIIVKATQEKLYLLWGTNQFDRCMCL
jgi:hypothetical protein